MFWKAASSAWNPRHKLFTLWGLIQWAVLKTRTSIQQTDFTLWPFLVLLQQLHGWKSPRSYFSLFFFFFLWNSTSKTGLHLTPGLVFRHKPTPSLKTQLHVALCFGKPLLCLQERDVGHMLRTFQPQSNIGSPHAAITVRCKGGSHRWLRLAAPLGPTQSRVWTSPRRPHSLSYI